MSVLKYCPYCGGHGYINQFEDIEGGCRAWSKTCIACNGTGTILCQETNADRIRKMSDEELAKFIATPCQCEVRPKRDGFRECGNDLCLQYLLKWLRQPAEEDT